ncbi:MAG: hypothetical protein JSS64_07085 [Bacteroidetes bacterium]|nr:hypothetical protein [Bacteroidota bacterium]
MYKIIKQLYSKSGKTVVNVPYLPFTELMKEVGLSAHQNQLERRKAKYPQHFREIDGEMHISVAYAEIIIKLKNVNNKRGICSAKGGNHV